MYKHIIKPILFLFQPDFVHNMIILAGRASQSTPGVRGMLKRWWRYDDVVLNQTICGIEFANPVGLSAGFDKNIELTPLMESVGFGFETGGSVTLEPRVGNPGPWFYRLPKSKSLVVHAGMANRGLVNISRHVTRGGRKVASMPLFISVAVVSSTSSCSAKNIINDARQAIEYILQHDLAQAIEINISCPNVGDDQPFCNPELLESLLAEVDKIKRDRPFFIKMPNMMSVESFDKLLKVAIKHDIQGVTIANLVKDRHTVDLQDTLPDEVKGGLSGLPTKERSTILIKHAYENYGDKLKIIGVGGIFSADDAYEKIKAGASLVAMITGVIFEGPMVIGKINRGIAERLWRDGYSSLTEAVGASCKKSSKKSKNL